MKIIRIDPTAWPATVRKPLQVWDDLPLCGCAVPEAAVEVCHWVLAAHGATNADAKYQFLDWLQSVHLGMALVVLYALSDANLTEHGTSVPYGWLTDAGRALLRFLCAFGTDPERWPEGEGRVGDGPLGYDLSETQYEALARESGVQIPIMEVLEIPPEHREAR